MLALMICPRIMICPWKWYFSTWQVHFQLCSVTHGGSGCGQGEAESSGTGRPASGSCCARVCVCADGSYTRRWMQIHCVVPCREVSQELCTGEDSSSSSGGFHRLTPLITQLVTNKRKPPTPIQHSSGTPTCVLCSNTQHH